MDQISEEPSRKISYLRRASLSDTNLPKFDVPHPPQFKNDGNPFSHFLGLGSLIERKSEMSLNNNTFGSSDGVHCGTQQTSSFGNAGPPPQTPTLKKSATTGFSLDGNKYYQQQASPTDSFSIHNTIPEYSAAKGGDLGGLTMMTLSSSRQQPAATSTIAAAQVGQIPLNKKSTLFGGLASFLSLDDLLNKPLADLKDREQNYRLIMALER